MHNASSIEATFGLRQHIDDVSHLKSPTIFFFFSSQLGAYLEIYQDITRSGQSKPLNVSCRVLRGHLKKRPNSPEKKHPSGHCAASR
jgi:hypothetical protein